MKLLTYDHTKIRQARIERGITIAVAAGLMQATKQQFSKWERGEVIPSANSLAKMCRVFRKTPNYFFERTVTQIYVQQIDMQKEL